MATIAAQQITENGTIATLTATAEAGDVFSNDGTSFIYYRNGSGESKTITITTIVTSTIDNPLYGDLTKANATQIVANGETAFIGPFPTAAYNGDDGEVTFTITPFDEGVDSVAILYI
tara:strand:+ start:4250 stop:4603 length:354 start_codon:yes stop_codon:yes gene_type:complete